MLAIIILVGVAYLALNVSEKPASNSSHLSKSHSTRKSYKESERQLAERMDYLFD